jgi:hypothetical protein
MGTYIKMEEQKLMSDETVQKNISPGQALEIGAALLKAIPKDISSSLAQEWIGNKDKLGLVISAALRLSVQDIKNISCFEKPKEYGCFRRWLKDCNTGDFVFLLDAPSVFNEQPFLVLDPDFTFNDAKNVRAKPLEWGRFVSTIHGRLNNFHGYEVMLVIPSDKKIQLTDRDKEYVYNRLNLDFYRDWLSLKKNAKAPDPRK